MGAISGPSGDFPHHHGVPLTTRPWRLSGNISICHKMLAEWELLLSLNSLILVYIIRTDFPVPVLSGILQLLQMILNIYVLVRLNCTARQCLPLRRKFLECYINNLALSFLCPATKSGGPLCYTLRTFECLSVRLSVRPSVRPSAVEHSCPVHNFDTI